MTPQQALDVLDRAAALAQMPRADHATVIQAVQVIRAALEEPRDRNAAAPQPAAGSDATP